MTIKQFFKSTAFKCIITLTCVLLVSGIFLTIMNGLLAVSDAERFERAINKIYGKSVKTETVAVANYNDNATIDEAYRVKDDGNYLIKATGKGGYDNGTVTCWIVVNVSGGAVKGIDKVVIESNKGQSYIDRVSDKALSQFTELYTDGIIYTQDLITNATVKGTKTAICNAVNGALDFVNALLGNVTEDIYAEFDFVEYIETKLTSHEVNEDGSITFHIVTKGLKEPSGFKVDITIGADGVITDYTVTENGPTGQSYIDKMHAGILDGTLFEGKDFAGIEAILDNGISLPSDNSGTQISTGATHSNYLCLYAAAFATKN
ncbi:MAG: hypothetical protein K2K28_00500, partial [Clostridia bacterium]|nr:hypothetical protein [Clostridia bacterium]